jgi:hypothetical protein
MLVADKCSRWMTAIVLTLAALAGGLCPAPVDAASPHPITRLTDETYDEAIACGRSGTECAVTPYLLCPRDNGQYSAYVATPFSRVASSVYETSRSGPKERPMSLGEANGWGIGIYVLPGNNPRFADSIQKVLIRKGNEVIDPITVTTAPAIYRGPASPPIMKGYFSFAADAFTGAPSITVVFTGLSGNVECSLDRTRLESMR